jgi:hypothetical protein
MKKLMLYALVVSAGIFGTGCTPGEVGAGAIGVGIGIGIGRHAGHRHGHHNGHRHCNRHRCWDGMDQIEAASRSSEISEFASRYQVPTASAAKVVDAFANAEDQGLDAFRALGLTDNDFKAMMNHQLPSDQTVQVASQKLDLSEKEGRQLLISMQREFNAQAKNVNSEYWKYCTSEGSWKTDQNRSCSSLNWPGCSPATGANFCY